MPTFAVHYLYTTAQGNGASRLHCHVVAKTITQVRRVFPDNGLAVRWYVEPVELDIYDLSVPLIDPPKRVQIAPGISVSMAEWRKTCK